MQIESTITISVKDIKNWISKSNSIHSLQSIRAKANKRIKSLVHRPEESPLRHIPIQERRKVLAPLFVNTSSHDKKQEVGKNV